MRYESAEACRVEYKRTSGSNWYRWNPCFQYGVRSDSPPPTSNHKSGGYSQRNFGLHTHYLLLFLHTFFSFYLIHVTHYSRRYNIHDEPDVYKFKVFKILKCIITYRSVHHPVKHALAPDLHHHGRKLDWWNTMSQKHPALGWS